MKLVRNVATVAVLAFFLPIASGVSAVEANRAGGTPKQTSASSHTLVDRAFALYESGKTHAAQTLYLQAARAGIPNAMFNAAIIRLSGESTIPSRETALQYLRASAQTGYAAAQFTLGTVLEHGIELTRDLAQAADWYERAAVQGHVDAALSVGLSYFLGRGRPTDNTRAARWLLQAAKGGEMVAQYMIASMYETGLGVERDLAGALEWYTAAARQGDIAAAEKARALADRLARDR